MPDSMKQTWWDTPLWKILATILLFLLAAVLLLLWHRMISMFAAKQRISGALRDLLSPIAVIAVTLSEFRHELAADVVYFFEVAEQEGQFHYPGG